MSKKELTPADYDRWETTPGATYLVEATDEDEPEQQTDSSRSFQVAKTDEDKMLVFGWSNVAIDKDGEQIVDLQGDVIDPEELEKAAYDHVLRFRSTGERHDPGFRGKGRLVESCVFTKEKQAAIGIPPGTVPEGWWVGYKIDDADAWAKIKKGEYQMFSIEGKGQRTPIENARRNFDQFPSYDMWLEENLDSTRDEQEDAEKYFRRKGKPSVAKSYEDMRKFNPFHDAAGKFSNQHGFATYSANPKTKAGAMAINRSNSAGHGRTLNVHAQSKGESIRQNANWLATGKKPAVPAATSRARYQQRKLKQQQAAQTPQQNPPTPQKQPGRVNATRPTQKPQGAHQAADGKDISRSFKPDSNSKKQVFDQVCEQQGFDKKPKVVKQQEFYAAVKATGVIAYRSWDPGTDIITGKSVSATDFKKQFMTSDSHQAAGIGGRVYGGGTYVATNSNPQKGKTPAQHDSIAAQRDSRGYVGGFGVTASITLDPSAKVADYNKIKKAFSHEPSNIQSKFKKKGSFSADLGAYAASKGYDAMRAVGAGWGCDYLTIFNRTKAIILDD